MTQDGSVGGAYSEARNDSPLLHQDACLHSSTSHDYEYKQAVLLATLCKIPTIEEETPTPGKPRRAPCIPASLRNYGNNSTPPPTTATTNRTTHPPTTIATTTLKPPSTFLRTTSSTHHSHSYQPTTTNKRDPKPLSPPST